MPFTRKEEDGSMIDPFNYKGVLASYMKAIIRMKEACGQTIISTKWTYKEFDEFTIQYGLTEPIITKGLTDAWAATRLNDCSRTFYGKCSRIAQLAKYMNEHGIKSYIMPLPKCDNDRAFVPYIFTEKQMQDILRRRTFYYGKVTRKDDPIISIPCLLRLLYSTGLRITEAVSLRNKDVDLEKNLLRVGTWGSTKNGEERLVPICSSLQGNLLKYLHYRNILPIKGINCAEHAFFVKLNGDCKLNCVK